MLIFIHIVCSVFVNVSMVIVGVNSQRCDASKKNEKMLIDLMEALISFTNEAFFTFLKASHL